MIDKETCDKVFIWNPSNWECEWGKSCDVRQYLDYKNCKRRKRLVDKLVEECSENIDENKLIYNRTLNVYGNVCNSCTICTVLSVMVFVISISVSSVFIYFH